MTAIFATHRGMEIGQLLKSILRRNGHNWASAPLWGKDRRPVLGNKNSSSSSSVEETFDET